MPYTRMAIPLRSIATGEGNVSCLISRDKSMETCKLCHSLAKLKKSHIYPKSYIKNIKQDGGQVLQLNTERKKKPQKTNFDPKEQLFCNDCEQFLSINYEANNNGSFFYTNWCTG